MKRSFSILLFIFFILFLVITYFSPFLSKKSRPYNTTEAVVYKIVDGDTFKVKVNHQIETIRLIGVDTPESKSNRRLKKQERQYSLSSSLLISLGKTATLFMKKIIPENTKVYIETDVQTFDYFGRVLAYVYLEDGTMLNKLLLEKGMADLLTIPPNVKYVEEFKIIKQKAFNKKIGLWSDQYLNM